MTSRDFCYWLQGYFEISKTNTLSEEQIKSIKNHLNLVFFHEIDPSFPEDQQQDMSNIHKGQQSLFPNHLGDHKNPKPIRPQNWDKTLLRC